MTGNAEVGKALWVQAGFEVITEVTRILSVKRERARQIILALAGLFYLALLYPLCSDLWHSHWLLDMNNNECEPMFLSFYVGLGLFLLLTVRKPSAHRSLIAFAAWSSLLHASVMAIETVEAWSHGVHRD